MLQNLNNKEKTLKKILKSNLQAGLSIVETMVATAIVGVGFVGAYSLTAFTAQHTQKSLARQMLQLQASQILEIIESDLSNIDNYNLDFSTCTAPTNSQTETYQTRGYEWCSRIDGELGVATNSDTRTVTVTTLADGRKSVQIVLESYNGDAQVVMQRVYDN